MIHPRSFTSAYMPFAHTYQGGLLRNFICSRWPSIQLKLSDSSLKAEAENKYQKNQQSLCLPSSLPLAALVLRALHNG